MLRLQQLLDRFVLVPSDWLGSNGSAPEPESEKPPIEPLECTSYAELVEAWSDTRNKPGRKKGAIQWNDSIDITFSAMLAVAASTKQQGAQIWLRVLGPPGTVKTTLCEAMDACREYCKSISMVTGFHSGQGGNELFQYFDGKTVIINEGDTLLSNPNREQILSQMRDMWSGKIRAHYKNGVQYELSGLRTTFIVAGTSTLRRLNRSAAGDRFIDSVVYERTTKGGAEPGEIELLMKVADMGAERTKVESGSDIDSQDDPYKVLAVRKTAGFVKYLRETTPQKVAQLEIPRDAKLACVNLAQLVAYMRARPDEKAEGDETEVELATRLTEQFVRYAIHFAVVLDRPIDAEVMRRVARLARDTCRGRSLMIAESLYDGGPADARGIEIRTHYKTDTVRHYLTVLSTIGCIKADQSKAASGAVGRSKAIYRLTPQMTSLMKRLRTLLEGGVSKVRAANKG